MTPPIQERLSAAQYWEQVHGGAASRTRPAWKRFIRRLVPQSWLEARKRRWERQQEARERRGLQEHWLRQLIEAVLRPQLAGRTGLQALEIGSAPGRISLELWRRLGLEPWGLEYTQAGVAAQKALYRRFGLDEALIMQGDLLDAAWRQPHAGGYDLVASFGLIEHFRDPLEVVRNHLELLRPGGVLVVTVPNLNETTWYGRLVRRFNPPVYAIHNTRTCTPEALRDLAAALGVRLLHCGTLGGPDIGFVPDHRRLSRGLAWLLRVPQPAVNRLNHLILGNRLKPFPRTAATLALVAVKP